MSEPTGFAPWLHVPLRQAAAHPAHALLLHGAGDGDRYELALALAAAWLCEGPVQAGRACGGCASCRLLAARSHPDLRVLLPEVLRVPLGWAVEEEEGGESGAKSKAKPSREIRIDELRAAVEWGQRTSARARAKVIVLHPADALNAVSANALLKTLEEPPGRLRLVLTVRDPELLMPTLRSRCQRIALPTPEPAAATQWLQGQGVDEAAVLLAAAGGDPRGALALRAEGIDSAAWLRLPAAIRAGHAAALLAWPVPRLVDSLQKLALDLQAQRVGATPRWFAAESLESLVRESAPDAAALAAWSRDLAAAARQAEHPWHAALRIEALVARAAALWQTPRQGPSGASRALDTLARR